MSRTHASRVLLLILSLLVLPAIHLGPVAQVRASDIIFNPTLNLSNNPGNSNFPRIAAQANLVYAVWQDTGATASDIFFARSANDGASFNSPVNLSNNGLAINPEIAAAGNNVYIVWQDNSTGNDDIKFRASTDYGANFAATKNLSLNSRDSVDPQIVATGNNVYVAWQNDASGPAGSTDIFATASTNNGGTFLAVPVQLTTNKAATSPQIAAVTNRVYVTWRDHSTGPTDILFARSTDSGTSFSSAVNLSNNAGNSLVQVMATTGNNVYVAWQDDTPDPVFDILLRASTNNGTSFNSSVNLSSNSGISLDPQIAATGTNVYVVWRDTTPGTPTVLFRASSNQGTIFSTTTPLGDNPPTSSGPQVATSLNNVYVAWSNDVLGADDVLFRSSSDNGVSFGNILNLSSNTGFSTMPMIAVVSNKVHVLWVDDTPGNNDVLFRAAPGVPLKPSFTLIALAAGWNTTNPTITVFNGRQFTAQAIWGDSSQHIFALYTANYPSTSVTPSDNCNPANTNGCLAKSPVVTSSSPTAVLSFTPGFPLDDFTGPGIYQYYCQYHPNTMHGTILVIKNPDINSDGIIDIVDIATVALAFESTPGQPRWYIPADIDNNGIVDIVDVATSAFYFGQKV